MQQSLQQLEKVIAKLPQRKISALLLVVIVIYLAFLTAQLVWMLWPQESQQALTSQVSSKSSSNKRLNINKITSQNLFGVVEVKKQEEQPEPEVVINDAPETSLNISLTGVVAVDKDDKAGLAIIESQGKQDTYAVTDVVTGTRARIEQILFDRVIIKVGARFETLMLDGIDYSKKVGTGKRTNQKAAQKTKPVTNRKVTPTKNKQLKQELISKRRELLEEPGKLFDYIRISPKRVSGEIVGYTLNPGKDPKLFRTMGLKNNDLAISINGYMLTDMQQAMSAIRELRNASSATIVIDRDGEQRDVLFSLE